MVKSLNSASDTKSASSTKRSSTDATKTPTTDDAKNASPTKTKSDRAEATSTQPKTKADGTNPVLKPDDKDKKTSPSFSSSMTADSAQNDVPKTRPDSTTGQPKTADAPAQPKKTPDAETKSGNGVSMRSLSPTELKTAQQRLQSDPQLFQQVTQQLDVKSPNEGEMAKSAFAQMLKTMDKIQPNTISIMTTNPEEGSVGIIHGTNMVRAFVSKDETDQQGYKIAEVVDFVRESDGKGIQVVAHETSKEGGTLVDEKEVDPKVLQAILKHVRSDAQVQNIALGQGSTQHTG